MPRWIVSLVALGLLGGCRTAHLSHHEPDRERGHDHDHDHEERPAPLGADLRRAWCSPAEHVHESRRGTPYVHAFHVEPAFLGRDLLVHAEKEGSEHALEAEIEYALTRRLLVVGEVPYRWTGEDDGFGDLGLGVRGLLVETDRFLLSAQAGFEWPTARGGSGADEVVVAPSLLAWADLGCWFTLQGGATLEYGTETGDRAFSWGAALAKSFACRPLVRCGARDEGFLSLFVEGRGTYGLSGPDEGVSAHELLFGLSAPTTGGLDTRAGWTLRWDEEDEGEGGWVVGFVIHL